MSGRSRRKKLVRSKRLSKTDSLSAEAIEQQQQQQQQKAEVSHDEGEDEAEQEQQDHAVQPPPLETVETVDLTADFDEATTTNEDSDQNKPIIDHHTQQEQGQDEENHNKLVAAAASQWRSAADMGDSSNPKWRRVAVRAIQLQDAPKVNGGLKNNT